MKRVHFILKNGIYPIRVGGMEIFNYYLIKYLRHDYKVSYSSYFQYKDIDNLLFHKLYRLRPSKIFEPIQFLFYLLFNNNIETVIFSFSRDKWLTWKLYEIILRKNKIKYIVIIHLGQKPSINSKSNYIRDFLKGAKDVIAVSNDIKENYDAIFNIKCKIIYPVVPFEICNTPKNSLRSAYSIPEQAFVICMVGSIKKMKNPDTIIKAVAHMNSEHINEIEPYLVFAGDGDMLSDMKRLSYDVGIGNRVLFLGNIPKENVNRIYHMSDVYLISSDYEGTSVSLLEAMYNSMPIISARSRGLRDMLTDGYDCLMFELHNENDLMRCIIKLYEHRELSIQLGINAKASYNKHYNYDNVLFQLKESI